MSQAPSAAAPGAQIVDLGELVEHQPFGRFAMVLLTFASITMFLEGFEMQLVGYAAPAMIKALHVDKAAFGSIFGAGNFGYMFGALLLGSLGDRFGRRRLILSGVFLFSIFTLAAAYGTTLAELSALRFIAGIGLGGAVPNAIALIAEYAPRGRKATRIALLYVAYTIGGAGSGLVASQLMPDYGWQIIFLIGGWSGLVMGVLLWFFLPESVRFLAQRDPAGAALRRIVARMRPDRALPADAVIKVNEEPRRHVPVKALFEDGRAATTLLLWGAYITGITSLQFMTSWLPTLINGTGIELSLAVFTASLFHIGGTFGNVVVGWFADRKGLGAIAVGFLIAVPIVALMGPASTLLPALMVAVFFAGLFIVGSQNGLNAVSGIIYPTWMRSTGAGWTTGVGRIGSIIGPVLGGVLISSGMPISTLFLCVVVPLSLSAGAMALIARRDTGGMSGDAVPSPGIAKPATSAV